MGDADVALDRLSSSGVPAAIRERRQDSGANINRAFC